MSKCNEVCELLESILRNRLDDHYILMQHMVLPLSQTPTCKKWPKIQIIFKKRTGVEVSLLANHVMFCFRHDHEGPGNLFKEIDDKYVKLMYRQREDVDCLALQILHITKQAQYPVHHIFPGMCEFHIDYAAAKLLFFGYLNCYYDWNTSQLYCENGDVISRFSNISIPKRVLFHLRKPPLQLTFRPPPKNVMLN